MNHYTYEEIEVGLEESFSVIITEEMMEQFKSITGDVNYLHNNEDFAKNLGYKSRVVYGMLTASFLSTLVGVYLPGENSLIQNVETWLQKPVFIGDVLQISGIVNEKNDNCKLIVLKVAIRNQNGEKVLRGSMRIGFLK